MQTRCDEIAEALVAQGLRAVALHGGRTQSEREAALRDFRGGTTSILVCQHTCLSYLSHRVWLTCNKLISSLRLRRIVNRRERIQENGGTKSSLTIQKLKHKHNAAI